MTEAETLLQTVIQGGYCIGCGACAAVEDSPFRIAFDAIGRYQASADPVVAANSNCSVLAVCPFTNEGPNEDTITTPLYTDSCERDPRIGYHLANYAAYVTEGSFRRNGSSGGMVTWLCAELFRRGLVDAVVHVEPRSPSNPASPLFAMSISRSEEEICGGAKSRYYPIEMSGVLQEMKRTPGRYAVVGLPCFIKAVRRLALHEPIFQERIAFCIGLVCGQLKTAKYAEMMAWQADIPSDRLVTIDFRCKVMGCPTSAYATEAVAILDGRRVTGLCVDSYGEFNWGCGLLKYSACDYCDDVVSETADVALGDAWLPKYMYDSRGTNIVIVRNRVIHDLLMTTAAENRVHLESVSSEMVVSSQIACFRHRRQELPYRLFLKDKSGAWRPRKRVASDATSISNKRRKIQDIRLKTTALSHIAFQQASKTSSLKRYEETLRSCFQEYRKWYRIPLWKRIAKRMLRELGKWNKN